MSIFLPELELALPLLVLQKFVSSMPISSLVQLPASAQIAAFFVVWLLLWLPIAIPLAIWLKWQPPQPITEAQKLPLLASLYLLAPLVLWGAATIEHASLADYGLPWDASILRTLGLGFGIGVTGLAGMWAIEAGWGWLIWQPDPAALKQPLQVSRNLLITLLLGLWISATEEVIFRGFLLNHLQSAVPAWIAAAIASLIFALLHLIWEGRDNVPQLPGLWLMGMVLTLARWVEGGNLGLAWGLHAGWIWAIASLDSLQAIAYTGRVPEWVTGRGGKPLAGVMGILFLLVTGAVLFSLR
jgi:uncharacterized protein